MPEDESITDAGAQCAKVLRVHYDERGWVEYRRPVPGEHGRKDPEERMADVRDSAWKALRFSAQQRTFVSA